MKIIRILALLVVALMGQTRDVAAQRIVSMHIDSTHCTDDSLRITIGYEADRDVVVENPPFSIVNSNWKYLFNPGRNFQNCDSVIDDFSCTLRFPFTFSSFAPGSVMTLVDEIDYVRLKIEKGPSDIVLALECPNGQFASLMNAAYGSDANDGCYDEKFDTVVGWDYTGENAAYNFYLAFGMSVNGYNINNLCDSTDYSNRPGEGWNYCWSENSRHQYAPGLIWSQRNTTAYQGYGARIVDSTDFIADTHYYHPQQSFNSLIGCPLNGTWNIVVYLTDLSVVFNGYVFESELAFNDSLCPMGYILSVEIYDDAARSVSADNTTLAIAPPATDTTIDYSLRVVLSSGDTLDTVFSVHWKEPFIESVVDTLGMGDTARWTSLSFTTDTIHHIRATTVYGCDSIVDLNYTFMPSYYLHDTLPFCSNEQFIYEGVDYGGPTTIIVPHQSQYGCDSTVAVHLILIDSAFHLQLQMGTDGVVWSTDTVIHGCRPMTVWLCDTTLFEQWRLWSFGDGDTLRQEVTAFQQPMPFTHTYDSVGEYTITLTAESIHGCVDSAVFRDGAVRVHSMPEADFSWYPTDILMHDPWTRFYNTSSPFDSLTFLWQIPTGEGTTDTTSEVSPTYHWPVTDGDLDVALIAFWTRIFDDTVTLVCADTTIHSVTILNDYLQFPTLVTPDGDGVNDIWEVVNLVEIGLYPKNELWIYNSWGVLVFHAKDIYRHEDFWDPNERPCPDGTYFFRFSGRGAHGIVKRNGVIEVVRD